MWSALASKRYCLLLPTALPQRALQMAAVVRPKLNACCCVVFFFCLYCIQMVALPLCRANLAPPGGQQLQETRSSPSVHVPFQCQPPPVILHMPPYRHNSFVTLLQNGMPPVAHPHSLATGWHVQPLRFAPLAATSQSCCNDARCAPKAPTVLAIPRSACSVILTIPHPQEVQRPPMNVPNVHLATVAEWIAQVVCVSRVIKALIQVSTHRMPDFGCCLQA